MGCKDQAPQHLQSAARSSLLHLCVTGQLSEVTVAKDGLNMPQPFLICRENLGKTYVMAGMFVFANFEVRIPATGYCDMSDHPRPSNADVLWTSQ